MDFLNESDNNMLSQALDLYETFEQTSEEDVLLSQTLETIETSDLFLDLLTKSQMSSASTEVQLHEYGDFDIDINEPTAEPTEVESKQRFASSVSTSELDELVKNQRPKNTERSTKWAFNAFEAWRTAKNDAGDDIPDLAQIDINTHLSSKSESSIRVVRVQLNDGERVVGVRYPEVLITEVEAALTEQRFLETFQQNRASMLQSMLQSGGSSSQLLQSQNLLLSQLYSGNHGNSQAAAPPGAPAGNHGNSQTDPLLQLLQPTETPTQTETQSTSSSQFGSQSSPSSQTGTQSNSPPQEERKDTNGTENGEKTQTSSPQKAILQDITEVKSKSLAKALKPPITIKNFFKPTNKETKPESHDTELTNGRSESTSTKQDESPVGCDKKCTKLVREMSYEEFLNKDSSDSHVNTGGEDMKTRSNENIPDSSNCESETVDNESKNGAMNTPSSTVKVEQSSMKPRTSIKRSLDSGTCSSSQPAKRAKQATLFSTLKKMATKKEVENVKAVTCPICGKVFEKGTSNTDLNSHIDNCIIE